MVDKIKYYNDVVTNKNDEVTNKNFLDGILLYFHNIEFFFTFLKALYKKYDTIVIYPSFLSGKSEMDNIIFKVEGQDNEAINKWLNKKVSKIKNRHGIAMCKFTYNSKNDRITLKIHNITLGEGEIVSGTKNEYRK